VVAGGVACALLAIGLVVLAAGAGGDQAGALTAATTPTRAESARLRADRFDADRAFAELRRQVASGPRPAGSPVSRRLAERLRAAMPNGRFEAIPGSPGLRNVVGSLPGRRPAVVLGAHYDTKDLPGFVGANDGASGTAVLLELARTLRRDRRPAGAREVRFVFFDGEEAPAGSRDFYSTGLRGSRAYARRHARDIGALVLLDFVGEKGLRIPREAGSDRALWRRLRAAAARVGAGATFPARKRSEILDDHTPFVRAGVPAIDLIDFEFACFHKTCDDLSVVSADSLDRVGETVLELTQELRRAP
jgi:glutaminyl-peptide cyclotransferase